MNKEEAKTVRKQAGQVKGDVERNILTAKEVAKYLRISESSKLNIQKD